MEINFEQNKDVFIKLINENVKRQGIDKLLKWLCASDFFTAPASTRFHLDCKGGLCLHSLNVYNRLIKEYRREFDVKGDITIRH